MSCPYTYLVSGEVFPPVSLHLDKVDGPVEPAAQLRGVHVHRELLVLQFEHVIVLAPLVHQVDPPADVARVGHKPAGQAAATVPRQAVRAAPVSRVDSLYIDSSYSQFLVLENAQHAPS